MVVPQSRQGSPPRPYTRSLRRKLPGWPWKLRKSRKVVPPCLMARRSTCFARRSTSRSYGFVEVARPRQRMHAGQEQRLVGVDVAQPRRDTLVEQHALERRAATAHPRQPVGGLHRHHVGTHVGQRHRRRTVFHQRQAAELAHVAEVDGMPVEVEGHVHMAVGLVVGLGQELARHAQVDHEERGGARIVIEAGDEVLAVAMQPGQPALQQCRTHRLRRRLEHAAPADFQARQAAPGECRRQGAADAFDLGQFRHYKPRDSLTAS
jgi:hypothetical protein